MREDSTTSENVQTVKRGIDAYNERDIDRLYELAIADFEWVPAIVARFEGESVRGRDGMEAYFREVEETWGVYRLIADEVRDLGDQVLVIGRIELRGRASGLPTDTPWGCVFHFRDGKLARAQAYLDHGDAKRAAGLSD
ncbi:MAG TPA: nuclear transport factor 2 family protein [Solirubrobacteraceae bacterium]|jgi:ketosteroid isomerase-like protein